MIPLAKPKGNVKRNFSESDSDYDPTEEYYQDANFVYPRLESTADLDGDDFAWNPGQRKRKRLKKHPTSMECHYPPFWTFSVTDICFLCYPFDAISQLFLINFLNFFR